MSTIKNTFGINRILECVKLKMKGKLKPKCSSARQNSTTQKKTRIVMVPRRELPLSARKYTKDTTFNSLITPPSERKPWQVDSIAAILSNWPEFSTIIRNESEMKEISRCCEMEQYNPNSFIFCEGDLFDSIYIIFSGQAVLVREKTNACDNITNLRSPINEIRNHSPKFQNNPRFSNVSIESTPTTLKVSTIRLPVQRFEIVEESNAMQNEMKNLLEYRFGICKDFEFFDVKKSHSIIGVKEIKKQKPWKYTAIITKPSYIIRIDSSIYRKTVELIREEEQIQMSKKLFSVPEFEPLHIYPEIFERLSENMKILTIPKGLKKESYCNGWMVIQSGSVARRRMIDFRNSTIDPRALYVGSIPIKLPKKTMDIKTESYGPNHCVADPSFSRKLKKPFTLDFLEDTVVHIIQTEELKCLIPISCRREIEKKLLDDPSDNELIKKYVEREMLDQWKMYKHQISKETKSFKSLERIQMTGEVSCRKPNPPKTIKDHQLSCENPRFKARRFQCKSPEKIPEDIAPIFSKSRNSFFY